MNSENTKLIRLVPLLAVLCIMTISSCSKGDELVGSWSSTYSLNNNDYTIYRAYKADDYHPTLIHTIELKKAENGDLGTFTDYVNRLFVPNNDENIFAGSTITGKWEVKDGKLHLYYDEIKVIDASNLNDNDIAILENAMTERFLADFKEAGANGLKYKIEKKKGNKILHIDFGNTEVSLSQNQKSK